MIQQQQQRDALLPSPSLSYDPLGLPQQQQYQRLSCPFDSPPPKCALPLGNPGLQYAAFFYPQIACLLLFIIWVHSLHPKDEPTTRFNPSPHQNQPERQHSASKLSSKPAMQPPTVLAVFTCACLIPWNYIKFEGFCPGYCVNLQGLQNLQWSGAPLTKD